MITSLLMGLGAFFCMLIFLLAVPLYYDLKGRWQETVTGEAKIRLGPLGFSLARTEEKESRIRLALWGKVLADKKPKGEGKEKKEKKDRYTGTGSNLSWLDWELLNRGIVFFKQIFKALKPQYFKIKGVLGFGDPYYTGLLAGFKALIPGIPRIYIEPDFTRRIHDITVEIKGRIVPLVLICYTVKFFFSPEMAPVRKYLWEKRKSRKGQKNATHSQSVVYSIVNK